MSKTFFQGEKVFPGTKPSP